MFQLLRIPFSSMPWGFLACLFWCLIFSHILDTTLLSDKQITDELFFHSADCFAQVDGVSCCTKRLSFVRFCLSIVGLQLCSIRVLLRMPVPTFLSPRLLLMLLAPLQMEDLIAEDIMYLSHKMQKYEAGTDLETPCLLIDFQGARKFRAGEGHHRPYRL